MKKRLSLLLAVILLLSALSGCASSAPASQPSEAPSVETESAAPAAEAEDGSAEPEAEEPPAPQICDDGRARPSSCGRLQVVDGKLCDESGESVMLRGVSTNSLITSEGFLNDALFRELVDK